MRKEQFALTNCVFFVQFAAMTAFTTDCAWCFVAVCFKTGGWEDGGHLRGTIRSQLWRQSKQHNGHVNDSKFSFLFKPGEFGSVSKVML